MARDVAFSEILSPRIQEQRVLMTEYRHVDESRAIAAEVRHQRDSLRISELRRVRIGLGGIRSVVIGILDRQVLRAKIWSDDSKRIAAPSSVPTAAR